MAFGMNIWKGASAFLFAVVLLQFYLIISETGVPKAPSFTHSRPSDDKPKHKAPVKEEEKFSPDEWTYDSARDHQNIGLTSAQCDQAFPDLYYEIDRAAAVWREQKHTISRKDISIDWRKDAAFQAMTYDNQLRIIRTKNTWQQKGYKRRALYVLAQLNRALLGAAAAGETMPNIEFSVVVDDMSLIPGAKNDTHSIWAFTRRKASKAEDRLWIVPDFNFYAAPPRASSFIEQQRRSAVHDAYVMDKIPKAIWRGAKWTNEYVRGHLLDVSKGKDWADIEEVDWKTPNNTMTMDDMCRYMFTVHTEGRSWSGRLKFLLNCDSVLVAHKLDWTAEFYHLLKPSGPDQNYIAVNREFSDLEEKINYYLENPQEAQRIADNAAATFRARYISPAAESCYWRRLIQTYSEVSFAPDPYVMVKRNRTGEEIEEKQGSGRRELERSGYEWIGLERVDLRGLCACLWPVIFLACPNDGAVRLWDKMASSDAGPAPAPQWHGIRKHQALCEHWYHPSAVSRDLWRPGSRHERQVAFAIGRVEDRMANGTTQSPADDDGGLSRSPAAARSRRSWCALASKHDTGQLAGNVDCNPFQLDEER
ncbi:uncharacterized protein LTR77_002527 [Saxophila tyrrhenica]|uniref:Glycosyl transferase CAP10 domain-containing protein n=1 Tax=Saxophila tyrrhenica TaxID=1690608 RepID=A0AAV9PNK5_9PEZI|nr:hypothetical protein LTR77_002527 [Saxophila tyrrhenica]